MNELRNYQQELYINTRNALLKNRSACVQLATGGGKTAVMASMCESVYGKDKRAWIVVPRKELLNQASAHLTKWNVPHSLIAAGTNESRAFKIHVVSKNTLIRRYEKIKNWPDLLIFDEAHLYYDRQIEIISHLPESSKVIGMTATPERLDGRGLSDIYDTLIEGPSIPWLTERGYLAPLRYFSPPLDGLANLKTRGYDYDEEQLEELLERKKVYGELVGHYEKYGKGKQALIFCRSVKSAEQTAERFRDKGFNFHHIEGQMSGGKVKRLLDANRNGEIDGLCTCDLILYGVDIPRVEYGATIRPTLSRALYMQMIGRVIRPYPGKENAIWMDHVNMVLEHQDENYPGIPLHYVPEITWNFEGTEKRKRKKPDTAPRLCPHLDFIYCDKPSCANCPHNPDHSITDARKPMVVIEADLKEIEKPLPFTERPYHERREFQDRIGSAVIEYKNNPGPGPIELLLQIADELGYSVLWAYWRLTENDRLTINIPVLHEIARIKNYKPGWVYFQEKKIRKKMGDNQEYKRVMGE